MGTLSLSPESKSKPSTRKPLKLIKVAVQKQQAKPPKKKNAMSARKWLKATFPNLLYPCRPFAIGLSKIILNMAPEKISKKRLRNALYFHCTSPAYLACRVPGAARVGIDGNPNGEIVEVYNGPS